MLKELDRLARMMRWCTVLLEYASPAMEQMHLLHQYDVAIITTFYLNATIDENEACASLQR